jgi:carboxyl-terminal processing protease
MYSKNMKTQIILLTLGIWLMSVATSRTAESQEQFGGIGVVIAQLYDQESPDHHGEIVVLGAPADSAAGKSGLHSGDVIVEVDGHATKGIDFAEVVRQHLRGAAGSTALLKIRRVGIDGLMEFKITRVAMKG